MLVVVGVYLWTRHDPEVAPTPPQCRVVAGGKDGGVVHLTPAQAANAATIAVVGTARRLPQRAVTIALATALQESGLRNLDHGDRDSLGLFQQRPSQGWGTAEQVMDPAYAAGRFYEHLTKVHGYQDLPLTVAAQRVQRSAFPDAYAKHEADATVLAAAFTGTKDAQLTCEGDFVTKPGDPAEVRRALVHDFGDGVLAKTAATTSATTAAARGAYRPTQDRAARGDGSRTVTVPIPAGDSKDGKGGKDDGGTKGGKDGKGGQRDGERERRGRQLAYWAVAHALTLHIERVGYAGREWTASSHSGWRTPGGEGEDGKRAPGVDRVLIVTAR